MDILLVRIEVLSGNCKETYSELELHDQDIYKDGHGFGTWFQQTQRFKQHVILRSDKKLALVEVCFVCFISDSKLSIFLDSKGIRATSSVIGVVWLDGGVDGGCEVDGCVWGDKDGEDVVLEGDDSGIVSMAGNSRMSRKDSLMREKHSLAFVQKDLNENWDYIKKLWTYNISSLSWPHKLSGNKFLSVWERANTIRIFKLEMSSNGGLRNKYLDLPIYGSSDSPDSILSCAQSSSLPKLFYRRSIKGWAFSEGILDVTCSYKINDLMKPSLPFVFSK
ncbi:hypothetical protein Tco_1507064 [Tanacetum coccineum]